MSPRSATSVESHCTGLLLHCTDSSRPSFEREPCWSLVRVIRFSWYRCRSGRRRVRLCPQGVSSALLLPCLLAATLLLVQCGPSEPDNPPSTETQVETGAETPPTPQAEPSQERPVRQVRSQTLYVPTYSHIHIRDADRTMNLTTTLSVRNASPTDSITLVRVDYYDKDGNEVERYLSSEQHLPPLSSTSFVVEETDTRGGVGANFIVRWRAEAPVRAPVVETVMITAQSTQGISFVSTARVISEDRGDESDPTPNDTL